MSATRKKTSGARRLTSKGRGAAARKATRKTPPRARATSPEAKPRQRTTPRGPAPERATTPPPAAAPREGINKRAARHGVPEQASTRTTETTHVGTWTAPAADTDTPSRRDRTRGGAPLPDVTPEMVGAHEEETPEEPLVPTPTSFDLDLRRTRKADVSLEERFDPDPQSALAVAAGDHDVSPESAEAVGDETPGGDNPTPDMDVVDLIGRSLGVEYEDNEELKGVDKITQRDRKRWELDPASAEDFKERNRS